MISEEYCLALSGLVCYQRELFFCDQTIITQSPARILFGLMLYFVRQIILHNQSYEFKTEMLLKHMRLA